jgi:hypothetical protein
MWAGKRFIPGFLILLFIVGCTGEAPEKPNARKTSPSERSTQVTPSDSKMQGKEASSGPARARNSAPTVKSVSIEPELPRKNSTLKARIEASDPDGDTIFFSYQWVKNGDELIGETSETLVGPTLKKGDKIVLHVSPYDMAGTGEEAISQEIVILNSAPVITSSPKAPKNKSALYTYQLVAEDPDGDPITFSLSPSSPQGMTIDPQTGLIKWKIGRDVAAGTYTIEIIAADDDEGRCTQKYTLTIRMPKS